MNFNADSAVRIAGRKLMIQDLTPLLMSKASEYYGTSGLFLYLIHSNARMVQRTGSKRLEVFQQGVHPIVVLRQHLVAVDRAVMAGVGVAGQAGVEC